LARPRYLRNPHGNLHNRDLHDSGGKNLLIAITAVLASIAIAATIIIVLPRTVVATFAEDELLVSGRRGGFSLPRDAVVNNNVVCITRTRWVLKLRVTHGSIDYTIPLSKWQYNRLVNKLRKHWGWVPPECWW